MFSPLVRFFRSRREDCDCCDHNIDIAALLEIEDETRERQKMKKRIQNFLTSLRPKKTKTAIQRHQATTQKFGGWRFKQLYRRVRDLGKKSSFEVRRVQKRDATNAAADAHKYADPLKSAVRQLLNTIFADIVEKDHALTKQTDTTTQCFLVHPLSDLDPNGSFLSRYVHPSPQAFDMDFNLGLSFVSSWLQSSLTKLKNLYSDGEISLQMPFCVLETTQANVNARARAMQRLNPNENVGIATLDIVALKSEKLVASAEHTFDFLRVTREEFPCAKKLLVWAESDEDGRSTSALRSTVLTVFEWQKTSENASAEGEEIADAEENGTASQVAVQDNESEQQWARWAILPEKKDSGITSRAASRSSNGGVPCSQDILVVEGEWCPRCHTL